MRPAPFARFSPLNLLSWRLSLASQAEAHSQPPLHHGLVQGEVEVAGPLRAPRLRSQPRTCRPEPLLGGRGPSAGISPGVSVPAFRWPGCPILGPRLGVTLLPSPGPGVRSWLLSPIAYFVTCAFLRAGPASPLPGPRYLMGA